MLSTIWKRLFPPLQDTKSSLVVRHAYTGEIAYQVRKEHLRYPDDWDSYREHFPGGHFQEVPFFRQNLAGTLLSCCHLGGARFDDADLTGATLRECDLRNAHLERARCAGADLSLSDLTSAVLLKGDFSAAIFLGARLLLADLREALFLGADLRNAIVVGSNCRQTRFWGTNFRGAHLNELDGADLSGANLIGATLEGSLAQVRLRDTLCDRTTQGADGKPLQGAGLRVVGPECDLQGVYLRQQDLRGLDLQGADLRGAVLDRCRLEGTTLAGADLRGATLLDTDLAHTCTEGARRDGPHERLNPRRPVYWAAEDAREAAAERWRGAQGGSRPQQGRN